MTGAMRVPMPIGGGSVRVAKEPRLSDFCSPPRRTRSFVVNGLHSTSRQIPAAGFVNTLVNATRCMRDTDAEGWRSLCTTRLADASGSRLLLQDRAVSDRSIATARCGLLDMMDFNARS